MRLKEKIMIHNELNQKLFDENNSLREDISQAILRIVAEFIEDLQNQDIPINIVDIWLVGSNASYNYSENSDLDVHIISNFDEIDCKENILVALYNYAKKSFNSDYDITIKGLPVELYIEDLNTTAITNGIYSVLHNDWIKYPSHIELSQDFIESNIRDNELYKIFYNQYQELTDDKIQDFIDRLYMLRKSSLANDGEFGIGNMIFKEFRNQGILDELKAKLKEIRSEELTLENLNID